MATKIERETVDAVRRFSRFYTQRIGVLHEGYLGSDLSLAEGRVVYELGTRPRATARELCSDLGLDPGYLSRILKRFEGRGLLQRTVSIKDARQAELALTTAGRALFEKINRASSDEIAALLADASELDKRALIAALDRVERTLGRKVDGEAIDLRPHRVGDIGWVIHRHGVIYAEEYGWDTTLEAMVARVAADFIDQFKPGKDCCWIADRAGMILGSAFVVQKSETVAKLRLVYVEHSARGTGLGRRLLDAAMTFAREAGYKRMTLWTNDVLVPARRLYERAGFVMTESEAYRGFGKDLVGETWDLAL